jgi:hypothetical protein
MTKRQAKSKSRRKNPHAVALGRLAAGHTSPAKQRASRENGKKGWPLPTKQLGADQASS